MTKHQNISLFILRLIVASIFIYAGYVKAFAFTATPDENMPQAMLYLMQFLFVTEILGGGAILIGFLTRWAATGLAIIMLGAVAMMQFGMGIGFATDTGAGWNFPLICLGGCLILATFGAGSWSLDAKRGN